MAESPDPPTPTTDSDTPWKNALEHHFPEFLAFSYNCRLFERYDRPVASLAVLADDSPTWRPSAVGWDLFGCRHVLEYPLVKLLDYAPRLEALLEDPNPFGLVSAAHLLTRQTCGDAHRRYAAKWRLARLLYERDWDRQRIIDLFAVIDWMMRLPPELENKLWQELTTLECNKTMAYVTSVERIGYQRGHLEGHLEGREIGHEEGRRAEASALVQRPLRRRFGPLSSEVAERIADLPLERSEELGEALLDFTTVADLEAWLHQP